MPNKQEFLNSIRTKYPAYAGTGDDELYNAITTKYPQYKTQITESEPVINKPQGFLGGLKNTVSSIAGDILPSKKETQEIKEPEGLLSGTLKSVLPIPSKSFTESTSKAAEKTFEAAKGGVEDIGAAGKGLAEGKYTAPEAFARGGLGAQKIALSPVTGVIGQGMEEIGKGIPQDFKDYVGEKVKPTIEDVKAWYDGQSPEQQQKLKNIGVGTELLMNFWMASAADKQVAKSAVGGEFQPKLPPKKPITPKAKVEATPEVIREPAGDGIISGTKIKPAGGFVERIKAGPKDFKGVVGEKPVITQSKPTPKIKEAKPTFREKTAGLSEKDIAAIDKTPEFKGMVESAKKSLKSDYTHTPYWEGAKKAEVAYKELENNLNAAYKIKSSILKGNKTKIKTAELKKTIENNLANKLNIKKVKGELQEIKGRGAQVDITNKADLRALEELEKVIRSKTPLEFSDRIQAMQSYIYDNSSKLVPGGVSAKMKSFIKQQTGVINKTLKEQLPPQYAKVMKEMSDDITLRQSLDRIFKITGEGSRGEMTMKRLVTGTTTSGEVKNLALEIKKRLGIDLIKEARMRQLAMKLAGDARADTLFGVIEKQGIPGVIGKTLRGAGEKTFFNPEKLAIKRATKGVGDKVFSGKPKIKTPIKKPKSITDAKMKEIRKSEIKRIEKEIIKKPKDFGEITSKQLKNINDSTKVKYGKKTKLKFKSFDKEEVQGEMLDEAVKMLKKEGKIELAESLEVKGYIDLESINFKKEIFPTLSKKYTGGVYSDGTGFESFNLKSPIKKPKPFSKASTAENATPKVIKSKAGFINPGAFVDDLAVLSKKFINPKEYEAVAKSIVSKFNIAKENVGKATLIVKEYMRKYGAQLKDKLGELFDDLADKVGARSKLIGGEGALKSPVSKLQQAKNMKQAGKTTREVWKETGWQKGYEGKWTFEINDSLSKIKNINPRNAKTIGDVLEHKQAFSQYPELKNTKIEIRKLSNPKDLASFNNETNTITINSNQVIKKGGKEVLDDKVRSILLHEMQHKIQLIEGFPLGADSAKGAVNYVFNQGEIQARTVQDRLIKTLKWKKENPPLKLTKAEEVSATLKGRDRINQRDIREGKIKELKDKGGTEKEIIELKKKLVTEEELKDLNQFLDDGGVDLQFAPGRLTDLEKEFKGIKLQSLNKAFINTSKPVIKTPKTLESLAKTFKTQKDFEKALNVNYSDGWKGNKAVNADELKKIFKGYGFHGTNAVKAIQKEGFKKGGYWNSGVYFSDTPDIAIGYGNQVRSSGNKIGTFATKLDDLKIKEIKYSDFRNIQKGDYDGESLVNNLKRSYDGIHSEGETLVWNIDKINSKKLETLSDIFDKSKVIKTPNKIK